ncbi:MAG: sulfotransferase, partial [Flavobacteriales bacterium]|nr:sulfotransferase [Flavobacteriales bacterium]
LLEQYLPGCRIIHIIRDGREVAVSMLSAKERIGFGASSIQGCAIEWADSVKAARAHGALIGPQRYMELRYEQLVERTADERHACWLCCGLPADDEQVRGIAEANHISRESGELRPTRPCSALRTEKGESWSTSSMPATFWFNRIAGAQLTGRAMQRRAIGGHSHSGRRHGWPCSAARAPR